jgi:hypothetical protein
MSESSAEANEADVVEQQTPLSAEEVGEMGPELSPIGDAQAAEGDVLEQRLEVTGDDEYVEEEE